MSVFIEPGCCWGRIIGEDNDSGACDLCVQICPAVFEKPMPDLCARVRLGADLAAHAEQVLRAAQKCPVEAIRVTSVEEGGIVGQSYKWVPVIDEQRCTGCGLCVDACGPKCLEMVEGLPVLARPDDCGSEEHCIAPCTDDAIHMSWVSMSGDESVGRWLGTCLSSGAIESGEI